MAGAGIGFCISCGRDHQFLVNDLCDDCRERQFYEMALQSIKTDQVYKFDRRVSQESSLPELADGRVWWVWVNEVDEKDCIWEVHSGDELTPDHSDYESGFST